MAKQNDYRHDGDVCIGTDEGGNEFVIDESSYEIVSPYHWDMLPNGYFISSSFGKTTLLHRLIMGAHKGYEVDHINHKKFDCRKLNLRICTRYENAKNRPMQSNNSSGYKGVSWHKKNQLWRARIKSDHKMIELGYYKTPEQAYSKYCDAAKKYHGEFACEG